MEYNDIDKILKSSLFPSKHPSKELNNKIINQMKESDNMKMRNKNLIVAACAVICLLFIPISVYGAYKYLLPKEAAIVMEDIKLGESFEKDGEGEMQTVTDGAYTVTYLGHVTGESISERTGSAWELHPDRIYVAVAIEKTDKTEMTYDDSLFISPLIQGQRPWSYNIASMNGSYVAKVVDGVLYRIIECDNIELFSDRELYLAVADTTFYSVDAFDYDEGTGLITVNEAYEGTNILFPLELDTSKADSEKAEAYLKQLEKEWNNPTSEAPDENNAAVQQDVYTDMESGITFHIKDNKSSEWWAEDSSSETVFNYNFEVKGDGIESLTYTLNKGEFCYYPENNPDGIELFGNEYSVSYDEQEKMDYQYSINVNAKFTDYGYDVDYLNNLGREDIDARNQIYFDVLNKEVESTNIKLEIKMEDGRIIEKMLTLDNLFGETEQGFWIAISVD